VKTLEDLARAAQTVGVIIYDSPDTLRYETLDEPIREACRLINASGWVFTAESCSGHPDATNRFTWGFNEPYLRLTCESRRMGELLDLLSRAAGEFQDDDQMAISFGLKLWRYPDKGIFSQVGVYIVARTIWERDAAMRIFENFGRMLGPT
jgi:hypothetical protein